MTAKTKLILSWLTGGLVVGGVAAFATVPRWLSADRGRSAAQSYVAWESARPFVTSARAPIRVFAEPSTSSQVLAELPVGGLAFGQGALHAGAIGPQSSWYKVKTRAGIIGWCPAPCGDAVTVADAESLQLRDQQTFESALRTLILEAAKAEIVRQNVHGGAEPDQIAIVAALSTTESAARYTVPISALMRGTVISSNIYKVDLEVSLYMQLNKDLLVDSQVEIQEVRLLSNELAHGFTLRDVANFLGPSVLGL